ncbi:MAG TPA: hypothetical protein VJ843_04700 [Candidatus Saccharimonadales bacterium]|nr:hypothetical protein [Candidatus Saccharimonadales bacterium]
MPLARYPEVTTLTVDAVGADVMEGMLRVDENTLAHSLATGAMTMEAMRWAGCTESTIALGAVAGVLHDVGKFHPKIQHLMAEAQGQKFTPDQARLMRTHASRGFLSLARNGAPGALRNTPAIDAAAYTALMHHHAFTKEQYATSEYAGIAHTVQLCDVAHARLLDSTRSYRVARDGAAYTPHQIGRQIVSQFTELPPQPDGQIIPVEGLVLSWAEEATRRQDLALLTDEC